MSDSETYTNDDVLLDARSGDLDDIKLYLDAQGPEVLFTISDEYSKATPLHNASANGHVDVVAYLLSVAEKGGKLKEFANAANYVGNTALHWAALTGSKDVAKLLLEAGADPSLKNDAGLDAVYEAESNDHEELVNLLLEYYPDPEYEEEAQGEADSQSQSKDAEKQDVEMKE